jgi:hypothetical protein
MRSHKTTRGEEAALMRRLVSCMPASKFEMQTLCRLAGIKATRSLPSAAVECIRRPRLLINPDFVKKYCKRDEHLFILVMHEIWHVMLAHTRMYPRMTNAQNIAFDAVINAGLMREFNRPEHRGFFEAINPADKFPHCLLRPPEGWPTDAVYPEDIGPPGTKEILMRLYPPRFARRHSTPLYEEILSLLLKSGMSVIADGPFLLGNHDAPPTHDPIIKDIVRQAAEKWPRINITGQGQGGRMGYRKHGLTPTGENIRRVFSRTLRLCLGRKPGREVRKSKTPLPTMMGTGVLPNARDRLAPARRMLGAQSTLWAQPGEIKARIPERPSKAYVYLDVSGSMNYILPYLLGLLLPYVYKGRAEVFQFSTEIAAMSLADLRNGKINTTGGTNINCVLEHVLKVVPKVERVLLLTDGMTGAPTTQLAQSLSEHNLRMNVVLPNNGNLHYAVQQLATSVVTLPPLN